MENRLDPIFQNIEKVRPRDQNVFMMLLWKMNTRETNKKKYDQTISDL